MLFPPSKGDRKRLPKCFDPLQSDALSSYCVPRKCFVNNTEVSLTPNKVTQMYRIFEMCLGVLCSAHRKSDRKR